MSTIGLDLGGTNTKHVVLGADGRVSHTGSFVTPAEGGPQAVTASLIEAGQRLRAIAPGATAIGIGIPGLSDHAGRTVLIPNIPGSWEGFPLLDEVHDGLGMPTTIVNDARAFTLAEGTLGAGRDGRIVVCLTLGTGIGGGILIDGELFSGAFGTAGEIGHQTVDPDGPMCGCGNRGCVEAVARADVLTELAGQPDVESVFTAVAAGDDRAVAAVDRIARWIGIGIANVVTTLGPDRVVIGGGIAQAGPLLMEPIRAAVRDRVTLVPADAIEIRVAELGVMAGAIGAALAARPIAG